MDCNKEEAIRAKEIAEKEMQRKDFQRARKVALKAQQLCPELENISQMLMVCDVHCSAEKKLFGNEMDWYGILQVEQGADEATLKKQYRKFALLLHPDKNNFAGAEAAFKLIGEAQRVLLDRDKRYLHDIKRKSSSPYPPPQKVGPAGVQRNYNSNFTSFTPQHQQPQQQAQPGSSSSRPSFWTVCPFCSVRYQYYREVVNRSLQCQNCKKPFIAYDINAHGVQPQPVTNLNHPTFTQQKDILNQGVSRADGGCQRKLQVNKPGTESFQRTDMPPKASSEKVNGKRRRKLEDESSESCDSRSSSDIEEDIANDDDGDAQGGQNFGSSGEHCPRRSTRHRQKVSYKENLSDDEDFVSSSKETKRNGPSCSINKENERACKEEAEVNEQADHASNRSGDKQKESDFVEGKSVNENKESSKLSGTEATQNDDNEKWSEAPDSSSERVADPEFYTAPDPDFSDFDKVRNGENFAVGQIWAAYDSVDAMPRYYARIKKVFHPGFKVQITWLESDPDNEEEKKWAEAELPVSCGKFELGTTETSEDLLMFSHMVSWEKGTRRNVFEIYPRKGETWALFRNWDIKWNCAADCNRQYEYEFVEILSDYDEDVGVDVAFLGKMKGFSSLFRRMVSRGKEMLKVPANELFRFSHKVPSFQMTGKEREDVPEASFELDPAALPTNLEEIAIPEDLKEQTTHPGDQFSKSSSENVKSMMGSNKDATVEHDDVKRCCPQMEEDGSAHPSSAEAFEIPEPEFYNFDAEKSHERLRVGQIWALYSNEDGLPKSYGQIKKIDSCPEFELHVTWLASCALPNNAIRWHDSGMPICCGRFKISRSESQSYTSTRNFSHLVRADPAGKRNEFFISPRKGEVWALYRNWTAEIRCSDLGNCEYDIVEIIEEDYLQIAVLLLERVDGFNSVFKTQVKGGPSVIMRIPQVELLRFSHQIPAFRLTEEGGGKLRGFWTLDPSALPVHYFG